MQPIFEFKKGFIWLAGGALRSYLASEPIQDYDLFFKHKFYAEHVVDFFLNIGFRLVFSCKKKELFTLRHRHIKVQLIVNREYADMETVLSSFDFTITQFITDGKILMFPRRALRHLRKKELHIAQCFYPASTIHRIHKYASRGYRTNFVGKEIIEFCQDHPNALDSDQLYLD